MLSVPDFSGLCACGFYLFITYFECMLLCWKIIHILKHFIFFADIYFCVLCVELPDISLMLRVPVVPLIIYQWCVGSFGSVGPNSSCINGSTSLCTNSGGNLGCGSILLPVILVRRAITGPLGKYNYIILHWPTLWWEAGWIIAACVVLTHWTLGYVIVILKVWFLNTCYRSSSWALLEKNLWRGECHRTPLKLSQHWFR